MQKQFVHDPVFLQIRNSSTFKDKRTILEKTLNGDNPYSTKFVMAEEHKTIVLMMELLENGSEEFKISASKNTIRTTMLFDGLVANNCLVFIILKAELLLGKVKSLDTYFDLHPDLNEKDHKIKEMISLRNKISDLGYPHVAFYFLKEHTKQRNLNTNVLENLAAPIPKISHSHLTQLSITRSMSFDHLNKRIKSETDHKTINLLGYFNLRHSR